jgi:hypothetical protein
VLAGAVVVSAALPKQDADLQEQIVSIAGGRLPLSGLRIGVYSPSHVDTFFLANERVYGPSPATWPL